MWSEEVHAFDERITIPVLQVGLVFALDHNQGIGPFEHSELGLLQKDFFFNL